MQPLTIFFMVIMLFGFSDFATSTQRELSKNIVEGKHYVISENTSSSEEKKVIEFFSFYCGGCFITETEYRLPQAIKENLPEGVSMEKYHVNGFGGLSDELSAAWAIANVLGIQDQFKNAVFVTIHKNNALHSTEDIINIFNDLGVSSNQYESMKSNFLVQVFISRQSKAFNELKPDAIPAYYVNNKYKILSQNLSTSSKALFINDYSRVINYLIDLDKK